MFNNLSNSINPESVSFTFGFRGTALAELENNAVRAHSFLLVAAEQILQAAEVSFGSTEVKLPADRPGYQAVLVFYCIIHLVDIKKEGKVVEMHVSFNHSADSNTTTKGQFLSELSFCYPQVTFFLPGKLKKPPHI